MKNYLKENKYFIILLLLTFFLCLTVAINIEFNSAPDEAMRYELCSYLANNIKLPFGWEEEIRNSLWGISYAFTPYLASIISSFFMRFAMLFTDNFKIILLSARMVSVLSITGFCFFSIKISKELFKGIYRYLFVILTVFIPQIIYLGGYVNNDSFALLSTSMIVYAWILGYKNNWDKKSIIILGIGNGLCAMAYYNAYGFILCSLIFYIWDSICKKVNKKEFFKKGIAIFLIAFAIFGWYFIRNYIIYEGDILGFSVSKKYGELYAIESLKPSNRSTPANLGWDLFYMLFDSRWIITTMMSFVGVFGYMNIFMPYYAYVGYYLLYLGCIIGFIILLIKKFKNISQKQFLVSFLICIFIPIFLSLYYSYFNDFQPQGRYIISLVIPLMVFLVLGFKNIINLFTIKEKTENIITIIFIGILLTACYLVVFNIILL